MTSSQPWLLVTDPDYFRRILGCMVKFAPNARKNSDITVRFGLTGDGIRPNYQIEEKPHRAVAYMGSSPKKNRNAPGGKYADCDLSQEKFTFQDIQGLLKDSLILQNKIEGVPSPK